MLRMRCKPVWQGGEGVNCVIFFYEKENNHFFVSSKSAQSKMEIKPTILIAK